MSGRQRTRNIFCHHFILRAVPTATYNPLSVPPSTSKKRGHHGEDKAASPHSSTYPVHDGHLIPL
eukprot:scaffold56_cov121-Skeletonema_marinoi.AAC.10